MVHKISNESKKDNPLMELLDETRPRTILLSSGKSVEVTSMDSMSVFKDYLKIYNFEKGLVGVIKVDEIIGVLL